jgi:hypothetical protein
MNFGTLDLEVMKSPLRALLINSFPTIARVLPNFPKINYFYFTDFSMTKIIQNSISPALF